MYVKWLVHCLFLLPVPTPTPFSLSLSLSLYLSFSLQEAFFGKFQDLVRSICQPMWESITWTAGEGEPQVRADRLLLLLFTIV